MQHILEISKKGKEMDMEYGNQVETIMIFIKESTLMIKNMGKEYTDGAMEQFIKDTLKMILKMGKVLSFIKMEKLRI